MAKRKKIIKNKNKLGVIASLTTKSIGSAISSYKRNKELEKIRKLKFQKLEEKNQFLRERKALKNWEERLCKESDKIKINEEELKI